MLTGLVLSDALRIRPYQSKPIFHCHEDTVVHTSIILAKKNKRKINRQMSTTWYAKSDYQLPQKTKTKTKTNRYNVFERYI
jgi:hypothetical protein